MAWPSREVVRTMVSCPKCGKEMQAKHLAYGHCCKGSVADRAMEAPSKAIEAFNRRVSEGLTPSFDVPQPHLFAALDAALGRPSLRVPSG